MGGRFLVFFGLSVSFFIIVFQFNLAEGLPSGVAAQSKSFSCETKKLLKIQVLLPSADFIQKSMIFCQT